MIMNAKATILLFFFCSIAVLGAQEKAVTLTGDTIFIYMDGRWTYEERSVDEMEETREVEIVEWVIDTTYSDFFSSAAADKKIDRPVDFYSLQYTDNLWKRLPPAAVHPQASHAFQFDKDEVQVFLIVDSVDVGLEQAFRGAMETIQQNPDADLNVSLVELVAVNGTDMIRADYTLVAQEILFRFNTYFYSGPKGTIQYTAYAPEDVFGSNEVYIDEILHGLTVDESEDEMIKKTVEKVTEETKNTLPAPPKKTTTNKPIPQKKQSEKAKKNTRNSIFYEN